MDERIMCVIVCVCRWHRREFTDQNCTCCTSICSFWQTQRRWSAHVGINLTMQSNNLLSEYVNWWQHIVIFVDTAAFEPLNLKQHWICGIGFFVGNKLILCLTKHRNSCVRVCMGRTYRQKDRVERSTSYQFVCSVNTLQSCVCMCATVRRCTSTMIAKQCAHAVDANKCFRNSI